MARKYIIEVELPDELVDWHRQTGLTDEGFEEVAEALMNLGGTDIDVRPSASGRF